MDAYANNGGLVSREPFSKPVNVVASNPRKYEDLEIAESPFCTVHIMVTIVNKVNYLNVTAKLFFCFIKLN